MKKAVFALAAVLALVLTASALGDDFSQGKGAKAAPNWKVLSLGSSGQTFTSKPARRARGPREGRHEEGPFSANALQPLKGDFR